MALLSRLLVLVALALLPAITTQVYNEFDLRRTRQIEVQRQANREPGAVSRTSALSRRARGSVDTQAPVRGYFLWVGGALLALLFAADSLLPAPPPSKLIESHSTRPQIRITSELKGPEAVVIDTSQPGFPPMLPDRETAVRSPLSSDVADAVQPAASMSKQADASDGSSAIPIHVRETLAQLDPGVSDQAGSRTRPVGLASEPQRNFVQTRSEKRRRPARHSSFDTTLEWCDSLSRGQGSCPYALMHPRTRQ